MHRRSIPLLVLSVMAPLATACPSHPSAPGTSGAVASVDPTMTATKTSCPTATSCFVSGNVSTVGGGVQGLFKGAQVGTDAYLAYQNALGGLDGRKFRLENADDVLSCSANEAQTATLAPNVIAFTGSFSLVDNCGGQVLAKNPDLPDVSVTLDPTTAALPTVFSVQPAGVPGMALGPLQYFKTKFPGAVTHAGTLVVNFGTAPTQWAGEKAAMESIGYRFVFDQTFSPSQTDFTQQIIAMEQAGVQMVVLFAINDSYGGAVLKDMAVQGFHPQVVWAGPAMYSGSESTPTVVTDAGGAGAVNGLYLVQSTSLYLGQDARLVPEITTFLQWVHGLYPGFAVDDFTLDGWASAELYVDALKRAGPDPTQQTLLAALKTFTTFDADGLLAPADPAGKVPPSCYLLAQVRKGVFQRVDMPTSNEFRCDSTFYRAG